MFGGEYLQKAGGQDAENRLDQEITPFNLVRLFVWILFASFVICLQPPGFEKIIRTAFTWRVRVCVGEPL